MKIVHIQDIFHPEAGYQENVLSKYQSMQGHNVTVIATEIEKIPDSIIGFFGKENIKKKDARFIEETGVNLVRVPAYAYISGRAIYCGTIFRLVNELAPDILFIHGNDTYVGMRYILKLGKLNYPVIFDNHMVDVASHNKFKQIYYLFYKIILAKILIKNDVTVIRTENDDFVQKRLGIPEYLSPIIQFGSDLLLFKKDWNSRHEMRAQLGISEDTFVVIYAGKLDEYKGGIFLANSISRRLECSKNLEFVIVGSFIGEYGNKVREIMEQSENKIHFFPTQKYIELPRFWQLADCAVFPKECSTTFFDAQACGLPVIAEDKININRERLNNNNGYCYKSNSMNSFREMICLVANLPDSEYDKMSKNACSYVEYNYNYVDIVEKINEEIKKQIEKWRR